MRSWDAGPDFSWRQEPLALALQRGGSSPRLPNRDGPALGKSRMMAWKSVASLRTVLAFTSTKSLMVPHPSNRPHCDPGKESGEEDTLQYVKAIGPIHNYIPGHVVAFPTRT